jgi:Zn-dependent protease with chaperone function
MRSWIITGCIVVLFAGTIASKAMPQEPKTTPLDNPTATTEAEVVDVTAPVAVPEPSAKAMEYYQSGNWLWILRHFLELAIPTVILFSGFSARLRNWAQGLGHKWLFIILLYFLFYSLIEYLAMFPFMVCAGYLRQHAYGLSDQTFVKWLGHSLTGLGVDIVSGALVIWAPYLLIRFSPRRWWLYTSLLAVPVVLFYMLVQPIWVDPLFNNFGPMKDTSLEADILALADRAGIEGSRVFEVDKSAETKMVNAYVTGFGGSKRIVLWDTLLAKLDREEVLSVMAHEMGHYVLYHIAIGIVLCCVSIFVALYAIYRVSQMFLQRWHARFGFDQLSDIASWPLVMLLMQCVMLVCLPLGFAVSRYMEHEADRFGLELTRNNRAAATAFVKLLSENLGNPRPGPIFMFWRGSHPCIGDRIDFANTYHPWADGEPSRYEHLFHEQTPSP